MFIYTITCFNLLLFGIMLHEALSSIIIVDKGILPIDKESIGIQFYIDVKNDHHWRTCQIHSWPRMCCFEDRPYRDCCTDAVYGDNVENIMAKRRDTLIYLYPTLYQHDQIGHCDFIVNFQCGNKAPNKRLDVKINFDTKVNEKKIPTNLETYKVLRRSDCNSLDEDSLNDCAPVNCDLKYSGRRPFFDVNRNKCVNVPACVSDFTKDIPNIVYVPKINSCRDLDHSIKVADIYAIGTGIGIVTESVTYSPNACQVQVLTNCSTVSENFKLLRDLLTGNLYPVSNCNTTAYSNCFINAVFSICACILTVTALALTVIFCCHIMVCLYKRGSKNELKGAFQNLRRKIKKDKIGSRPSMVNRAETNNLLKEIIVRDLPLELRESVIDICDRIGKEVEMKKRYRLMDLGAHVNFEGSGSESSGSSSARSKHGDGHN